MKKTINIIIASIPFTLEEEAYAVLDTYLQSIRTYFSGNTDKDEILKDIESRIAERLSENGNKVETLADVEKIINDMGKVSQFDEYNSEKKDDGSPRKQLYRDPDDALIGGVSSGFGYYLGIDKMFVRIIFILLSFLNGIGVLIYLVLWLILPEAKTASQKLEMRGDPVTLSTLDAMVKEKIEELNTDAGKHGLVKLLLIPLKIVRKCSLAVQKVIFPSIRIILGSILSIISLCTTIALSILVGVVIFGVPSSLFGAPVAEMLHGTWLLAAIVSAYFAGLVFSIFVFFAGLILIQKKKILSRKVVLSLLAVGFISIIATGISVSRFAMITQESILTNPIYANTQKVVSVDSFNALSVSGGSRVTYVLGDTYSVDISGRQYDIDFTDIQVNDGILTIKEKPFETECLFCSHHPIVIKVTAPTLEKINVEDGAIIEGVISTKKSLQLNASDGSSIDMDVTASTITTTISDGAAMIISGTVTNQQVTASDGSDYDAQALQSDTTLVTASDSAYVVISTKKKLSVTARDESSVDYIGNPVVIKKIDEGSTLEQIQ